MLSRLCRSSIYHRGTCDRGGSSQGNSLRPYPDHQEVIPARSLCRCELEAVSSLCLSFLRKGWHSPCLTFCQDNICDLVSVRLSWSRCNYKPTEVAAQPCEAPALTHRLGFQKGRIPGCFQPTRGKVTEPPASPEEFPQTPPYSPWLVGNHRGVF